MNARNGRAHAAAAAIICLAALAGCAGDPSTAASQTADDGISSGSSVASSAPSYMTAPITGEKSASSIADHIQQYLDQPRIITAYEKPILEQARDNGGLTAKQYEEAWSHFRMCMAGKGYSSVTPTKYPNGVYDHTEMTYAPQSIPNLRFEDDKIACYQDISVINQVYSAQVGNPNFYANRNEAIVDCLHRNELVPKDYTAQQFQNEELDAMQNETSMLNTHPDINLRDERVRGCFAANMSFYGFTY
ncbi:hypothetical protein G1C96_1779 [Bifidobacterium sp. DSM 109958]|uniref:Lipoprotein n=1 Tax=Bifidobacterium moraviense TaxID=2675323 RepID=A0A7Y0HZV1_9BIFI|nr:hypothetical protein [Bifidobacterium sp. DSM 109958]NMN01194.1 hypothetical protein [Bifidobacterium sp. DSM 109958]